MKNFENAIQFAGNIGRDAESRQAGNSVVANFSIAVSTYAGKDKETGQVNYETTWVEVQGWNKVADKIMREAGKGRFAVVRGKIEPQAYISKDGKAVAKLVLKVSFANSIRVYDNAKSAMADSSLSGEWWMQDLNTSSGSYSGDEDVAIEYPADDIPF